MLLSKGVDNFTDDTVMAGKKYYYRVTAVDQAGNESGYNGSTSGIVVPGRITSDVRWTVANSPYVIKGDITISEFGSLTIDDGVKVLIDSVDHINSGEDTSKVEIRVNGKLITSNGPSPIIFAADTTNPSNTWWKGIIFENISSDETILTNTVISDAETGIKINGSHYGKFKNVEIINCNIGALCSSNTGLELNKFKFKRCPNSVQLINNTDFTISECDFIQPQSGIVSEGNNGLTITANNFLNYKNIAIKSNDSGGTISFTNNLFVSSTAQAIETSGEISLIEYNTFDVPYAISIAKNEPTIRKNLILASASVFGQGMLGIEYKYIYLTPTFGPNNIYGFESNAYSGCNASTDSTAISVVLMKSVNAEPYDYRLRVDYPSSEDHWGITRDYIVKDE